MAEINHIGLCVTDLDRSRGFYEQVLGFEWDRDLRPPDALTSKLLRVSEPVAVTACYLTRGDFVLELLCFDRPGNDPPRDRSFTEPGLTHISFSVDDIPATCGLVTEHGGEVLHDTDLDGRAINVRDPDGQMLELLPMSYRTG